MSKLPKNTKVENVVNILKSGRKFDRNLITQRGFHKIPTEAHPEGVILNIVFFRDETNKLAILVRDERNCLKDYIWDSLEGYFVTFTPRGKEINWNSEGFSETPGIANNYIMGDFNEDGWVEEDTVISFVDDDINSMIAEIAEKEPAVAKAIKMVVRHIRGTYDDKYAKGQNIIDTKKMLYDAERGDFLNIYQVSRYLQRYITQGSAKSHLIKDVEKAIHYLIFELTRRILMGDVEEIEPKV